MDKVCGFCFNAYVASTLPEPEDSYFEPELNDSNDFSSSTIGLSSSGIQMYINSGAGKATHIEVCQWISDLNGLYHSGKYHTIAKYYPKFCPECGRPLNEYKIDERGTSFKRRETE